MTAAGEQRCAASILQLLLGRDADLRAVDWKMLHGIAAQNVVLVRLAECLAARGICAPGVFRHAVQVEKQRIEATLEVIQQLADVCSRSGLDYLCLKALQHYPDMGHDIDLLVLPTSHEVDSHFVQALPVSRSGSGLRGWVASTTNYRVPGCASPLEIYHGRLGLVGENTSFPQILVANCRSEEIQGKQFAVPRYEDQLILQGIQKIYERLYIRLSDVVHTVHLVQKEELDWDYILTTASQMGVFAGFCCYLAYIEQIHLCLSGASLLRSDVRSRLGLQGWGHVEFRNGFYRFPTAPVLRRVYAQKFWSQVVQGEWEAAARLSLIPLVVAAKTRRRSRRDPGKCSARRQ